MMQLRGANCNILGLHSSSYNTQQKLQWGFFPPTSQKVAKPHDSSRKQYFASIFRPNQQPMV